MDRSWQQKKLMVPGCEPASVRVLMEALRPLVLGQSLAGAGGGGFLYLLTREPRQQEAVLQVLHRTPVRPGSKYHSLYQSTLILLCICTLLESLFLLSTPYTLE